ncbi:MAG TPA: hypothetical protein VHB68_15405 [Steroidobacteraceae bacterium]|nr:hypothetical protein [Steroidobacteraceae bacterium]
MLMTPAFRSALRSTLCAALLTATLAGCAGSGLKPDAPAGVQLQGVWKLNRAASDDPQKIIDTLRAEAMKRMRRAMNAAAAPPPMPSGGGQRRRGGGPQSGGSEGTDQQPDELQGPAGLGGPGQGPGMDPLRNSPTMHALRAILQRSDYITIRQSPEEVSFDYGTTARSYTPGGHSVVSSETGVADQKSGWSNRQYVINIRPQLGPQITEEYGLSPDGKQLIVKSHIGPFELSKVNLTRVYDTAGAVVPNARPSID